MMGVIVGIVLAILLSGAAWHSAVAWFSPMRDDFMVDQGDVPSVMTLPLVGLMIVAIGLFVAGLIGAFAALRLSQWRPAGWMAVSVVVLFGFWNARQVAQPDWLAFASIVAPLVGAWLAERHFHRARPGDPLIG